MKGFALRLVAVASLILLGWAIGKAQTSTPDFMLIVDAPTGETKVECTSGCSLAWAGHGIPTGTPQSTFTYRCSGSERCSSAGIAGWVKR
jgi:hypothetical protein